MKSQSSTKSLGFKKEEAKGSATSNQDEMLDQEMKKLYIEDYWQRYLRLHKTQTFTKKEEMDKKKEIASKWTDFKAKS